MNGDIMNINDFAFWRKTDDLTRILIEKSCKVLIEDKNFPSHVYFDVPRSNYIAHISFTKDLVHEDEWRLQVGVTEKSSDKMFSCFLNHYTKEKLLEELNSEHTRNLILNTIKKMCIRADQED